MNTICENCGSEVTLPEGISEGFCGNCGAKITVSEIEAVVEDNMMVVEETETVIEDNVVDDSEPVVEDNDEIVEETEIVIDDNEVVVDEIEPVVEDNVVEDSEPVVEDNEEVVEVTEPVIEETTPVVEDNGTVVEDFESEEEPAPVENKPASGLDGVRTKFIPAFQNIRPLPIIVGIIICFLIGFIGVTVVIALSGNGSYKSAESKTFDSLRAINNLGGISGGIQGGSSTEFDITYAPSEDVLEALSISELFSEDIEELSADGIISAFGNSLLVDVAGHADSSDAHLVAAFNGNEATLAFPDATDYVYALSLTDTDDENVVTLDMNAYNKTIRAIEKEYFKIAERSYEVKKGDELTGGGITVKADKYTFKFTKEDTYNLVLFAIEEIRKNDNLFEYITNYYTKNNGSFDFEDRLDNFASLIDDALFDLSDSEKESTFFRMKAWVYKGDIISREIDNFKGEEDIKLSYTVLKNSKALYAKLSLSNDSDTYRLTADFKRDGKLWGGDLRLQFGGDDDSLKLTVKNMELSGKYLTGKATLRGTLSNADLDIDLEFKKLDKSQQITLDGDIEDQSLGTLTLTYQAKSINSLKLPVYDPDDVVIAANIYEDDDMYDKYGKMTEEIREYFE